MNTLDDILEGIETVNGMMRVMADLVEQAERRGNQQDHTDILSLLDELRSRAAVSLAIDALLRDGKIHRDADGNFVAC